MKRFLLLFLLSGFYVLHAQPAPEKYKFVAEIEAALKTEKHTARPATWYSFIGEYQRTLQLDELDLDYRRDVIGEPEQLSELELAYFNTFKPYDAISYIANIAKNHQIIILNEAHPKPLHRVFAEQLLDSLYTAGFRYLGLEALNMNPFDSTKIIEFDTLLNKRGYPYASPFTGTYTKEPQFGNFIRAAIRKGFYVFGYDVTAFQRRQMPRDSAGALNVQRILLNDPDAKIFLFCGYSHLLEQPQPCPLDNPDCEPWKYLAHYFKKITGIDALTINQEVLTERLAAPENPYYKIITADQPSVFVNEKGKIFNGGENFDLYDMLVYHPRTNYIKGRPDWLLRNGKFKHYTLNKSDIIINCPCQVRAYYENEPETATPADIIELNSKEDEKALVLPPGAYHIVIENQSGDTQRLKIEAK